MADWQYSGTVLTSSGTSIGPIDQGYYVSLPNVAATTPTANKPSNATGWMTNQSGDTLAMWITDVQMSFQIGGTTAQSIGRREFYPRNLIQPVYSINCQMPNSFQLQRLAEFIRDTQIRCLDPNVDLTSGTMLPSITIHTGGIPSKGKAGISTEDTDTSPQMNGQSKGQYRGIHAFGYVSSIDRGASFGQNAPSIAFQFSVAYSYAGIFINNAGSASVLAGDNINNAFQTSNFNVPGEVSTLPPPPSSNSSSTFAIIQHDANG